MALSYPTMAVTDFTKLPNEIIVDLINFDNGTSLTTDLLMFGLPTALPDGGDHNTTVVATAVPGTFYVGSVELTYNRVDMSTIPGARSVKFEIGNATKISDLVPQINAAYQLNLQPEDYVDGPLPALTEYISNEEKPFELIAGENSLIYRNRVTLSVYRKDVDLSMVILKTVLSGLIYRQPEELVV